jgi:Ser/Thr protein kinase RdoA (MazF antagonist)
MVAQAVGVEPAEAEKLARVHYGLSTQAARLTGERDENFKLAAADGAHYVLKIASASEDPAVSDLPLAALLHIERVDPKFPCPRVIRTRDGDTQCWYEDPASGKRRAARLLTYVSGKTLRSAAGSRAQRIACGRMAARLGLALRDFTHPAAQRPLIWDLRHVGKTLKLLGELPDLAEREALAALIERIEMLLVIRFQRLRQQAIHNDLNDLNVLVDPADEAVVTGVIDFGDLVHTALVGDVAILAADLVVRGAAGVGAGTSGDDGGRGARVNATAGGAGSVRDCIADVVMAYHEITPLLPAELVLLNPLIAGRILTDVVVASWHRRRNPAGTHYSDLEPAVIRSRVQLAAELLATDMPL